MRDRTRTQATIAAWNSKRAEQINRLFFLTGLALILIGVFPFWPTTLLVVGVWALVRIAIERSVWNILDGLVWIFGLVFLFNAGLLWPGVLVLLGLSTLLLVLKAYDRRRYASKTAGALAESEKHKNDDRRKNEELLGKDERFYVVDDVDDEDDPQPPRR